jgi:hypothetical protein
MEAGLNKIDMMSGNIKPVSYGTPKNLQLSKG